MKELNSKFYYDKIQQLGNLITKAETFKIEFPEDDFLELMRQQYEREKIEMEELYRNALAEESSHNIKFAIQTSDISISVDMLLDYVKGLDGVLKHTIASFSASSGFSSKNVTNLRFNRTYVGSFGLQFYLPTSVGDLFNPANENEAFQFFFEVLDWAKRAAKGEEGAKKEFNDKFNMFFEKKPHLAKRYVQFFNIVLAQRLDLKIEWQSNENKKSVLLPVKKMKEFVGALEKQEQEHDIAYESISGTIKGISLLKNRIEFVPIAGNSKQGDRGKIDAKFDKALSEQLKANLDCKVDIKLRKTSEITADDKIKNQYEVIELL